MFRPVNKESMNTIFRVGVMGYAACGKTSIVNQYLSQGIVNRHLVTVGQVHESELEVEEKQTLMEIWDTPGGYCFEAARQRAITICDAFVLVYAVNNRDSFERVLELQEDIMSVRDGEVPLVVVATKTDLPNGMWFDGSDLVADFVKERLLLEHLEISAKNPSGIADIFVILFKQWRQSVEKRLKPKTKNWLKNLLCVR